MFEFLDYNTSEKHQVKKRDIYLSEMGAQEYYIHQPDPAEPVEFRGWRRTVSGYIEELKPNVQGELFSRALNLWFGWEERVDGIRLLRTYLPDGTPLTTSMEETRLRVRAEAGAAAMKAAAEAQRIQELEVEIEKVRAQLNNR